MVDRKILLQFLALALVALLGLIMRLNALSLTGLENTLRADAYEYLVYAYNIAENHIYSRNMLDDAAGLTPDFYRTPGYPFFASLFMADDVNTFIDRVLQAQVVLNSLAILVVMLVGWRTLGYLPAFFLSLLYATSPHIINMNFYFLSESLMVSLVVVLAGLLYLVARNAHVVVWAVTGLVLAYASLTRPYLQYFIFLYAPYLFWEFGRRNAGKILALALGFMVLTVPWSVYKSSHGNVGADNLMVGTLHHGIYPNIEYNDIPETRGYPYRFDPESARISENMSSVLAEIARRFRTEPGKHLYWYLIGKPLTLWQWSLIQGAGDIYVYEVTTPPWDYLPHFQMSYLAHKYLHYPLLLAAVLFALAVWSPRFAGQALSREQAVFFRSISLLLVYVTLIHILAAPFPRYQIPQQSLMFLMGIGFFRFAVPFWAGKPVQPVVGTGWHEGKKVMSILGHIAAPAPRYMLRLVLLEKLFRRYIQGDNKRFLEIGPGLGDVSSWLMQHPSISAGLAIEQAEKAAQIVRTRMQDDGRFTVRCENIQDTATGRFDYVLSFEVLEHIEDDETFINMLADRIVPSGYWFISVPAYMRKWQKQDEFSGHIRRYEKDEITAKLNNAGLDVVTLVDYGFPLTSLMRPFRDRYYKDDDAGSNLEKTLDSGTENRAFGRIDPRIMYILLLPFMVLQALFAPFNLGDGFVVVARKRAD